MPVSFHRPRIDSRWSLVPALITVAVLVGGLLLPSVANALTIKGRVVNGTTGERNINADVLIVKPSGGMMQEQSVKSVNGEFEATGLDDDAPVYLVRVDFDGISYSEPVRPAEGNVAEVTVTIYEASNSWDGVRVSVPHLVARRHSGNHLEIEQLYEIDNASTPARTVRGGESSFLLPIPEDSIEITALYVTALGVPVERTPEPTGTPGLYRVDYPLRPGVTRVGVSYRVPYAGDTYTLSPPLLYSLDELTLFNVDPDMEVVSATTDFEINDAAHDMIAMTASDLAKGSELAITFTGGSGESRVTQEQGGTVRMVPNAMEQPSLILMLLILLALAAFTGIAIYGSVNPLSRRENLDTWYNLLVKRLAKLDDLHEAQAIPTDVYRLRRDELKTQLASLMVRINEITATAQENVGGESATTTATREQTNVS